MSPLNADISASVTKTLMLSDVPLNAAISASVAKTLMLSDVTSECSHFCFCC